jgi:hypothetical protein
VPHDAKLPNGVDTYAAGVVGGGEPGDEDGDDVENVDEAERRGTARDGDSGGMRHSTSSGRVWWKVGGPGGDDSDDV